MKSVRAGLAEAQMEMLDRQVSEMDDRTRTFIVSGPSLHKTAIILTGSSGIAPVTPPWR